MTSEGVEVPFPISAAFGWTPTHRTCPKPSIRGPSVGGRVGPPIDDIPTFH